MLFNSLTIIPICREGEIAIIEPPPPPPVILAPYEPNSRHFSIRLSVGKELNPREFRVELKKLK